VLEIEISIVGFSEELQLKASPFKAVRGNAYKAQPPVQPVRGLGELLSNMKGLRSALWLVLNSQEL